MREIVGGRPDFAEHSGVRTTERLRTPILKIRVVEPRHRRRHDLREELAGDQHSIGIVVVFRDQDPGIRFFFSDDEAEEVVEMTTRA